MATQERSDEFYQCEICDYGITCDVHVAAAVATARRAGFEEGAKREKARADQLATLAKMANHAGDKECFCDCHQLPDDRVGIDGGLDRCCGPACEQVAEDVRSLTPQPDREEGRYPLLEAAQVGQNTGYLRALDAVRRELAGRAWVDEQGRRVFEAPVVHDILDRLHKVGGGL